MTAIGYASTAFVPRASRTRLRLTARGRRLLAMLAALPAIVALAIAIVTGSSALASDAQGAPAGTYQTVTVMAGDSLWSIAQQIAPQADPRDVVADIERLNALGGSGLSAGQKLSIPTQYAAK